MSLSIFKMDKNENRFRAIDDLSQFFLRLIEESDLSHVAELTIVANYD